MTQPRDLGGLVGLIKVRDHCTFAWRRWVVDDTRRATRLSTHCDACVAAMQELGYVVLEPDPPQPKRSPGGT
jgi:hypothetical protein